MHAARVLCLEAAVGGGTNRIAEPLRLSVGNIPALAVRILCSHSYIPRGFEFVSADLLRGAPKPEWVRLVYTDGLYCISVYSRFLGRMGREQDHVHTVYDWGQGLIASRIRDGRETVVVADLPIGEIGKIADSIR
jgi:negative regulator of sigma E activity